MNQSLQPCFLDLKALAAYSSCSVRWLRDRLVDPSRPLPHYRVEGKILVKRDEFDAWMEPQRVVHPSGQLTEIAEHIIAQLLAPRRAA